MSQERERVSECNMCERDERMREYVCDILREMGPRNGVR